MKSRITSLDAAVIVKSTFILLISFATIITAGPLNVGQDLGTVAAAQKKLSPELDPLDAFPVNRAVPGVYDLSFRVFRNGVFEPVSSLPVLSEEMILMARVEDLSGNPAQNGTVTFEYCSYRGTPPGDIDNPDEAPKEACAAGTATWDRLGRASIGTCLGRPLPGTACVFFGIVQIPRDVGFRYKYAGRRGGIDSGMSGAANFTWTPAP